jgi:hypothetical protein
MVVEAVDDDADASAPTGAKAIAEARWDGDDDRAIRRIEPSLFTR